MRLVANYFANDRQFLDEMLARCLSEEFEFSTRKPKYEWRPANSVHEIELYVSADGMNMHIAIVGDRIAVYLAGAIAGRDWADERET